ncbi:multiple sugar transport system permease protein [Diaminobutyricimonas aerilata]|uniref:Multiple sugar transport system permease protein n=1 Tax=Diaminobutyricimonas aerilata TaxID=1162967 RepID=A0A2M9CP22_9MICO|nr:carbohydrate ABC transporter permease [Diaminobutyricimonas aerilata]PJJ73634.1 multiple sugar transport system permease protein [Diaminobutyricimonas aerilata]
MTAIATKTQPRASATVSPARKRARQRRGALRFIWYIAVILVSLVTVTPLIWTIATSLKPAGEVLSGALDLLPSTPTLENYVTALTTVPFGRYFFNSMVLSVGGALTNLFFGSLGGYALARLRFRGRNAVFAVFVSSLMIPGIVTMIPSFLVLRHFPFVGGNDVLGQGGIGFINTYWAVIIPGAAGAFAVFFMKQFFESLPAELGEAARIDGASEFRIFAQVYLPLAKAGLAVLAILSFQAGWNNFVWPLIVLNDQSMMTVQVGLAAFVNNYETSYGPLMAGTIVASLPVLLLFVFAQRYIIEGIAHVGSK